MTKEEFEQFIAEKKTGLATNLQNLGFKEHVAQNVAGHCLRMKALARSCYAENHNTFFNSFRFLSDPFYNEPKTISTLSKVVFSIKTAIKPEQNISFQDAEPRIQDLIGLEIQDMLDCEESCFAYMLCAGVFNFEPFDLDDVPQSLIDAYAYWTIITPSRESTQWPDNDTLDFEW